MTTATQRRLEAALDHHRAGRLAEAERLYRQVLRQAPRQDDALHLLGLLRHQQGDNAEAKRLIGGALKIRPGIAVYYENLAAIQRSLGDLAAVVDTCRRGLQQTSSVRLGEELIEALLGLGRFQAALAELDALDRASPATDAHLADRALCLVQLGQLESAAAAATVALECNATNGNALSVLADVATRRNQHALAVEHWRAALRGRPEWTAARVNLALSLLRLGEAEAALAAFPPVAAAADPGLVVATLSGRAAAYRALGQAGKAAQLLRQALAIAPGASEGWSNLSEMRRSTRAVEALKFVDRALAIEGWSAPAISNRALALSELDRLLPAIAAFRRAIAIAPTDPTFINNLAEPLRWLAENSEAMTLYQRSLAIDPHHAAARYGLGTSHLAIGDLRRGWPGYENRFKGDPAFHNRIFAAPWWQGETPNGTLLVWAEQGLGDEIIFGSMLPDLANAGGTTVVECDPRLVDIFTRSMPTLTFIGRADPPDPRLTAPAIVAQTAMASLAGRFRRRLEDFPTTSGYLRPHPDLIGYWRRCLEALGPGLKVGFAWRSRRADATAARFHPPILEWTPVLTQHGATFVSLQYGGFVEDLQLVERTLGVKVHRFPDLDLMNDLEGVLALSSALDLAVSSGTTAFCLPAAAGTPTWVLTPDFDFFTLGTGTYPWFPSVRIYQHRYERPWSSTIGRMAESLAELGRRPMPLTARESS